MGQIVLTIEYSDLQNIIADRDKMAKRIQELEAKPLAFSLEGLGRRVIESMKSLTPCQANQIVELIRKG